MTLALASCILDNIRPTNICRLFNLPESRCVQKERETMAKEPEKKAKVRRVKNPESFRQRAVKATEKEEKKSRLHFIKKGLKKVFSPIAKPLKKVGKKLGQNRFIRLFRKPVRVLGKILLIPYFKGSVGELRQVTWPSWKQSRQLTFAVLAFAVVFGAAIAGLDWVLGKVFKDILIK